MQIDTSLLLTRHTFQQSFEKVNICQYAQSDREYMIYAMRLYVFEYVVVDI